MDAGTVEGTGRGQSRLAVGVGKEGGCCMVMGCVDRGVISRQQGVKGVVGFT